MPSNYEQLRNQSLADLRKYMDSLPEKKGTILAYWIKDYTRFLSKEAAFDPTKLIRYKRGSIVKAHLGYRIGSEEGGLHYAVVVDTYNAQSAQTVTIIPFTSVKLQTDLSRLHSSRLYIGDEIYQALQAKILSATQEAQALQISLQKRVVEDRQAVITIQTELQNCMIDKNSIENAKAQLAERRTLADALSRQIEFLAQKVNRCEKMGHEIQKMKRGSIALIGQITTISKLRIYDPLSPADTLSNIRLSPNTMDKIDQKVRELFTKSTENCTQAGNNS